MSQMAAYFHVEVKKIRKRMIDAGIEIRDRHQVGKVAAEKAMARSDYIPVGTRAAGKPHKKPEIHYPFTKEQLYEQYVTQNMTQREIAEKYGVSQHVIQRAMKNMGIPSRVPKNTDQSGEKGSSWKGGRAFAPKPDGHRFFAKSQGYWLVKQKAIH